MKYILFSAVILALLTTCSKDDDRNSPPFKLKASDNLDELDYRLYSLILGEMFDTTKTLVVQQETQPAYTSGEEFIRFLKDGYLEMDTTIYAGYISTNDASYYLGNYFDVPSKSVTLVSTEEIQYIFRNEDINSSWDEFYRRFPNSNGTIAFSRLGYNTDKTQAMVEMGNMYASLGGEGFLILLKRVNGEWKILHAIPTWIS